MPRVHLINPSTKSFGVAVITPRWLYVLASATGTGWGDPRIVDETLDPLAMKTIAAGDVVGVGIHTGNARRGYEIGREARRRGAWVVFGGIHATLFPDEAIAHGSAHAVVHGDGDVVWPRVVEECLTGGPNLVYEGGRVTSDSVRACAMGPIAAREVHVGIRANRPRVPEALLIRLRVANRWPGTQAARCRGRSSRNRRIAPHGVPVHCARG